MKRRLHVILMAMLVLAMSVAPAFAVESGSTTIKVNAAATTMDVTVPTTFTMDFGADGVDTLPTDFTITNNSQISGIHVSKIEMTGVGDWKLLPASADTKLLPVNTKHIKFWIGLEGAEQQIVPDGVDAAQVGDYEFGVSDITLPATESKVLKMKLERGSFTTPINEDAYTMAITFDFN